MIGRRGAGDGMIERNGAADGRRGRGRDRNGGVEKMGKKRGLGRGGRRAGVATGGARGGGKEAKKDELTKQDVSGFLTVLGDFEKRLDSSRRTLDELSAQLGALARLSMTSSPGPEVVVPHLVEMHNTLSSIHASLQDSFEGIRARYTELRERAAAITGECTRELESRRRALEELWKRMEGEGLGSGGMAECMREERMLIAMSLDSYNRVLGTMSAMREVENRVIEVFSDFSEAVGRIDGLARAMGELISTDDAKALREELEALGRSRRERVSRYIW
ncbi:MAG: hypothetical protein QXH42_03320 [Thermoplasmata archaeon]